LVQGSKGAKRLVRDTIRVRLAPRSHADWAA